MEKKKNTITSAEDYGNCTLCVICIRHSFKLQYCLSFVRKELVLNLWRHQNDEMVHNLLHLIISLNDNTSPYMMYVFHAYKLQHFLSLPLPKSTFILLIYCCCLIRLNELNTIELNTSKFRSFKMKKETQSCKNKQEGEIWSYQRIALKTQDNNNRCRKILDE